MALSRYTFAAYWCQSANHGCRAILEMVIWEVALIYEDCVTTPGRLIISNA